MIDDPFFIRPSGEKDWHDILQPHIGQAVLAAGDGWIQYGIVSKECCIYGAETEMWFSGSVCRFRGLNVTKDVLHDKLKQHFPAHFEWLLFHPEWLL